jgi:hypothetical protein
MERATNRRAGGIHNKFQAPQSRTSRPVEAAITRMPGADANRALARGHGVASDGASPAS